MGFDWKDGLAAAGGPATFLAYKALSGGGGGSGGYAPIPYDNGANIKVDTGRLKQALQQGLGRMPTQNEIDQYSSFIKNGDLQYGDVTQIAQGLPEADKARLDQYAQQYSQTLGANDNAYLSQAADIIGSKTNSQFASLGRPNSSAMAAQVFGQGGQLAGQLAQSRQSALADFYGRGLQGNMGQYVDQGNSALQRGYNLNDSRTAYNRGLNGYQTQRNDYNTDLNNQNAQNRQRALYQLGGSLIGAGAGAAMGGAPGAMVGSRIGGQAGGLF